MERLTIHTQVGTELVACKDCYKPACLGCDYIKKAFSRLAYYEDLEEQGRLVVLPCKVGDTVYRLFDEWECDKDIDSCPVFVYGDEDSCETCPDRRTVRKIVSYKTASVLEVLSLVTGIHSPVYFSIEEAEAALRG